MMEDDILVEDALWWEDDLWWKTTFDGGGPFMKMIFYEDDLL